MFCPNCGTQLNEGQAFCSNCGVAVNSRPASEQPQGNPNFYGQQAPQQPPFGAPNPGMPPYGFPPMQPPTPMKWFKFLIYFLLFASAILNVISGIVSLTGGQYTTEGENVSKLVYAFYPNLKGIDIAYGIALIALGAFQIFTRFALASYKQKAPGYVMAMYIATAAITAIYSFAVMGIVPNEIVSSSEMVGQAVGAIIGAVLMVILNKTYFDKRKYLFVN